MATTTRARSNRSGTNSANGRRTSGSRSGGRRTSSSRTSGPAMDAIAFLKSQHRAVEHLFKSFERSGGGAHRTRRKLVDQMITALSQHASIEEQYFYPAVRQEVDGAESEVLEALEEHHVVKWQLQELEVLDPEDERFAAKVTVMMENVRHHVREEERELFPEVRSALGRNRLLEIGEALRSAGRLAPTRPHPRAPSTPPANLVTDPMAGAVDKARDLVGSVRPGR